ncbi:MAG: cyclic nucleotide-binding domain-containing protein [Cellvibrionales bacterium]|nr:cyclic nucleotide-binding domain-containing protein [Cellvibrionales bacterium]
MASYRSKNSHGRYFITDGLINKSIDNPIPLLGNPDTLNAISIDILRSFVPLNILSDDHLKTISRSNEMDLAVQGQCVANAEILRDSHLFLVSGSVDVELDDGQPLRICGGTENSHLSLGDSFPTSVCVTAVEDCQIFLLNRSKLDAMLCWDQVAKTLALDFSANRHFDEDASWMNTLLRSNLFHKIPPYNVKLIFDRFEARVVEAGEVIVHEGEQGDICYLIKEGCAHVSCEHNAESTVVAELTPGRCFGEDALLNKTTRNATVTMKTNGVLMGLHKRDFLALMNEPKVATLNIEEAVKTVADGARWLDVRSQQEYENDHRADAFHLPMHLMSLKSRLMDANTRYVAYCSTGRRASTVAYLLNQQGFNVQPLAGH